MQPTNRLNYASRTRLPLRSRRVALVAIAVLGIAAALYGPHLYREVTLRWAYRRAIQSQFAAALNDTRCFADQGDRDRADSSVALARSVAGASPGLFSANERRWFAARIRDAEQVAVQTVADKALDRSGCWLPRSATTFDLTRASQDLIRQRQFSQAVGALDQILILDPQNEYALRVRPIIASQFHPMEILQRH